ncbi:hypothetical protein ACFRH4_31075 [Streptomyces mirabilis]|uniref:hypothetical protein n=1 Tax=Streptomyces mirabilis TaxID=68239 RepID=UPI00368CFA7C
MASDGYHRALAAHQQAAPPRLADPDITEAVERQTREMRELSQRAFPEPQTALIETAREQHRRKADIVRAKALRLARAQRARREAGTSAAVPESGSRRSTA